MSEQPTRRGRRRPRRGPPAPADRGLHAGPTPPYEPLAAGAVERILDATFELMAGCGVAFDPVPEVLERLAAAGCAVAPGGTVRFPAAVIRRALEQTPRATRLWDRAGETFIDLDDRHTWFIPGMTAIRVYDLDSGEPRPSTRQDLATVTRVADALAEIDAVCIACKDVSRTDLGGEIGEFVTMAEHTGKPLEYLCERSEALEAVIEVAAAIRGGHEALAARPYFLHIVTPLPLYYPASHCEQIVRCAEAGVPVTTGTLPIGGASSPITVAGCTVHSLATDLAGMVLAQAVRPGAFCVGSSDISFMEPASGAIGSFSQGFLADLAVCQIRRALGLPSFTGIGGAAMASRFDQDAVWEISTNMIETFFARPATCDYLGILDQGLTYSPHALILCAELAGLVRTLWRGFAVDDETLALDLAGELGPRASYLGLRHTAAHCRDELWPARLLGAHIPLSTGAAPYRELCERIDADLRAILAAHRPAPLPGAALERLRALDTWMGVQK